MIVANLLKHNWIWPAKHRLKFYFGPKIFFNLIFIFQVVSKHDNIVLHLIKRAVISILLFVLSL